AHSLHGPPERGAVECLYLSRQGKRPAFGHRHMCLNGAVFSANAAATAVDDRVGAARGVLEGGGECRALQSVAGDVASADTDVDRPTVARHATMVSAPRGGGKFGAAGNRRAYCAGDRAASYFLLRLGVVSCGGGSGGGEFAPGQARHEAAALRQPRAI